MRRARLAYARLAGATSPHVVGSSAIAASCASMVAGRRAGMGPAGPQQLLAARTRGAGGGAPASRARCRAATAPATPVAPLAAPGPAPRRSPAHERGCGEGAAAVKGEGRAGRSRPRATSFTRSRRVKRQRRRGGHAGAAGWVHSLAQAAVQACTACGTLRCSRRGVEPATCPPLTPIHSTVTRGCTAGSSSPFTIRQASAATVDPDMPAGSRRVAFKQASNWLTVWSGAAQDGRGEGATAGSKRWSPAERRRRRRPCKASRRALPRRARHVPATSAPHRRCARHRSTLPPLHTQRERVGRAPVLAEVAPPGGLRRPL